MAEAQPASAAEPHVASEFRVLFALRVGPIVTGLLVVAISFSLYLALVLVSGRRFEDGEAVLDFFVRDAGRSAVLLSLLLGYVAGAMRWELRERYESLRQLGREPGEVAQGGEDWRMLETDDTGIRRSRAVASVAALVGLAAVLFIGFSVSDENRHLLVLDAFVWFCLAVPFLLWLVGRGAYFMVQGSVASLDMVAELDVDLFDLRPQLALGNMSLRGSALWMLGAALGASLWMSEDTVPFLIPILVVIVGIGVLAVLPVRGVQRQIAETKRVELARIHAVLAPLREPALHGDGESQQRLGGLLAYRSLVEAVSEWPFDASAVTRYAFFLVMSAASLLGGALVERLAEALLE